jgi:hypothetical protein
MKKISTLAASLAALATIGLGTAGAASAATPADKPVISSATATLAQGDLGPYLYATVRGHKFTPGGKVYTKFQDLTTDPNFTRPFGTGTVVAGNRRPVNGEGGNYGLISFTRLIARGAGHCNHWLRVWAWDFAKSPRAGYGWSTRTFYVAC